MIVSYCVYFFGWVGIILFVVMFTTFKMKPDVKLLNVLLMFNLATTVVSLHFNPVEVKESVVRAVSLNDHTYQLPNGNKITDPKLPALPNGMPTHIHIKKKQYLFNRESFDYKILDENES